MAKLIGGRLSGTEVKVIQWANDWVSIEGPGLSARDRIVKPTRLELTAEEVQLFRVSIGRPNLGMFWKLWQLDDNGRFVSLAGPPRRRTP
jgi:hypothetical protein